MTEVRIGVTLPQFTDDPERITDAAIRAGTAGLDSVFVFDHLWPLGGPKQRPIFESWTTLAHVAAAVPGIHVGTMVTRSTLRHPAVLGKMAATMAEIAPGRVIIAIGSGDEMSKPENVAYGIPYFDGDDRVAQMISAVDVVTRYVGGKNVSMADPYVSLSELPPSPRVVPPRIWIGGRSDAVLAAAARIADGWNAWGGSVADFERNAATIRAAAAGRAVELTWGGLVVLAASDEEARSQLGTRDPSKYVVGGPDTVVRHLAGIIEAGATHIVVTFPDAAEPSNYEALGGRIRGLLGV